MREILRCGMFAAVLCGLGSSGFAAGVPIDMPDDVLCRAENGMIQANHQEQLALQMLESKVEDNSNEENNAFEKVGESIGVFFDRTLKYTGKFINSKEFKDYSRSCLN